MMVGFLTAVFIVSLLFWIQCLREENRELKSFKRYDEIGLEFRDKWITEWKAEAKYYKERCEKLEGEIDKLKAKNGKIVQKHPLFD